MVRRKERKLNYGRLDVSSSLDSKFRLCRDSSRRHPTRSRNDLPTAVTKVLVVAFQSGGRGLTNRKERRSPRFSLTQLFCFRRPERHSADVTMQQQAMTKRIPRIDS